MRYKINKIGFLNYWLYDEEEFYFCDGKLLLRGSNGSGKTVTMVSVFPLLFDGNKNPERFDTFGSRDRKIEDYVLPQDSDQNENISYVYMEFYNKEINKYLTIGMGIKATRNRSNEFWGFALTDNRRIKNGFSLYKNHLNKVPLTKKECQIEVGVGGEFVTTIKDYKGMVNRLLFGFENDSMYSELINLMLQLRSPKLSKEYKPTKLEEILSGVLEPIPDSDIQKMSDSIENMNKYKEIIADLMEESRVLNILKNNFYDYSDNVLYAKAKDYIDSTNTLKEREKEVLETEEKVAKLKEAITSYNVEASTIKLNLEEVTLQEKEIDKQDINSLIDSLNTYKTRLQEALNDKENLRQKLENKKDNLNAKEVEIKKREDELYSLEKLQKEKIRELESNIMDTHFLDLSNASLREDTLEFLSNDIIDKKQIIKEVKEVVLKKDKLIQNVLVIENDIEKEKNNVQKVNLEKEKLTTLLYEEIDNIINYFYGMQNNKVLIINNEVIEKIKVILKRLDDSTKMEINDILTNIYFNLKRDLNKALNVIDKNKLKLNGKLEVLEEKKNNIKNIFENNIAEEERKEYVKTLNIDAKYLYELIEFKDNVSKDIQENLENALRGMGLLQTLVIKDNNVRSPKHLQSRSKVINSIEKYFNIVDKDYYDEVKSILESISTHDGDIYIDEYGNYKMGLIAGSIVNSYDLKFIGSLKREEYINKLTQDISEEIKLIVANIDDLNKDYQENLNNIKLLDEEYKNIISFDKYLDCIKNLKNLEQIINNSIAIINSKEESLVNINNNINLLDKEIIAIKKDYQGSVINEELDSVSNILNELLVLIKDILNVYYNSQNVEATKNMLLNTKEELEFDIDAIRDDIIKNEATINTMNNQIDVINDRLSQDKYKNIIDLIEEIKTKKSNLEAREKELITLLATAKNELEHQTTLLMTFKNNLEEEIVINKVYYDVFIMEYNLGYSRNQNLDGDISKWFKNYKIEKVKSLNDASDNFVDRLTDHLFKLQNYAGRKIYPFDNLEETVNNYTEIPELKKRIVNILINAKRIDIEFRGKSGKILNILELSDALEIDLVNNKSLLNEEDRKLFEDLLLNNVGDSIREKIRDSKKWVSEVKKIMEAMNTSSGLTFSIGWLGKSKDTEQEMDTNEIVNIFNADVSMLSDNDEAKIVEHFRSKIALEEDKYDDGEVNYIEVIKNVLDYRKWFQFKLYFKRAGGERRELTDKEFSKFSGGEKAIAMYIPLFAGINAKFNAARSDAPRIIALDEAFAGVDDANIEDSFRILEELDLDYILTSQILWGDYKTINSLAISELHHLPESDVISVMRFKWDGVKRNLITNESEYEN